MNSVDTRMAQREGTSALYPLMLDLTSRPVLVVGGGPVAERRVDGLLDASATVTVVAPHVTPRLARLASQQRVQWLPREFAEEDVIGKSLVLTATGIPAVDGAVTGAARSRGIFANSADDLRNCDFHVPAVERRGDIVIAVATGGSAPALAARLRDRFASSLGPEWERLATLLGSVRDLMKRQGLGQQERRLVLQAAAHDDALLAELARGVEIAPEQLWQSESAAGAGDPIGLRDDGAEYGALRALSADVATATALVSLVGAGPGAPDLLTVRAYERIREAHVIVYDDLVDRRVLAHAAPNAELIYAGKRGWRDCPRRPGPDLLVSRALEAGGRRVVRLKGGDPNIFGRSTEEIEALERAGVAYEVVPGVTAALAAAAAAHVSLTERGVAGSVTLATGVSVAGVTANDEEPTASDIASLVRAGSTVAVYMGLRVLPQVTAALSAEGLPDELPVVVVGSASQPEEQVVRGHLSDIACLIAERDVASPAIVIIGEVGR